MRVDSVPGRHGWAHPEALGEEQLSLLDAWKAITAWRQPHFWQSALSPSHQAAVLWRTQTQPDTLLQIVLDSVVPSVTKMGTVRGGTGATRKSAFKRNSTKRFD